MNPNVCYAPGVKFKPQWAFKLRPGVRGESFVLPFSFSVPANGQIQENYPWKLDDDVPWLFRAVLFPQIGTAEQVNSGGSGYVGNPALVRIRDTYGNPLTNCVQSNDLVLAVGAIGQSGFNSINAAGFPLGCEIECERGGTLLFDFLIPIVSGAPNPVQVQGTVMGCKLFAECD